MDPRASYKALLDRPVLPHDEDLQQTLYENEAQVPRTTLEELIREREGYVSAVDRAIRRLEAVVKRLSEQRVVACEELALCRKATSSPIRRLPPELLLVIFQCHVDDRSIFAEDEFRLYSESKQCRSLPSFLASVLKITHICRAWRGLAHGSPHLWQQIFICDMQAYGQRAVSNTVEWMQRAAPLPVSYTRYKQDTGGLLPTRRIRTLRLQLPAHDLDFLTSLSSSSIGKMFPSWSIYKSRWGALNHHRLPWNSLTDLVLNCLRGLVDDFYDILRGCTALVLAWIGVLGREDIITLPHLRTLSIACCGNISSFRQSLCLPDLVGDFDGDDFSVALTAILAHAPHVTELKMQTATRKPRYFRFLRLLPRWNPRAELVHVCACPVIRACLRGTQTLIPRLRRLSSVISKTRRKASTAEREEGLFVMNPLTKTVRHKLLALATDYMQVNV
ncbi:hypothetical protein BD626DRAFT_506759 [Schizophyllum amplum]|uniref:Uncharacterized protein n=1 Tax=Schizophyllum amplum TaxID=97359 RepID=A0A550C5A2_9AGAR|nr:hypothetical protein BD626DRAFT_506759 [Auriculariopsis ampla]